MVLLEWLPAAPVAEVAAVGRGVGKLFLSLLAMLVVPLVLASVVSGVASVPDMTGLRRMSAWTLGYYLMSSAAAVTTGMLLVNIIHPGRGLSYATLHAAATRAGAEMPGKVDPNTTISSLSDVFFRMVPDNVVAAASDNRLILGVITFAILLGVFTKKTGGEHARVLTSFFTALFEVMMRMK